MFATRANKTLCVKCQKKAKAFADEFRDADHLEEVLVYLERVHDADRIQFAQVRVAPKKARSLYAQYWLTLAVSMIDAIKSKNHPSYARCVFAEATIKCLLSRPARSGQRGAKRKTTKVFEKDMTRWVAGREFEVWHEICQRKGILRKKLKRRKGKLTKKMRATKSSRFVGRGDVRKGVRQLSTHSLADVNDDVKRQLRAKHPKRTGV